MSIYQKSKTDEKCLRGADGGYIWCDRLNQPRNEAAREHANDSTRAAIHEHRRTISKSCEHTISVL